MEFPTPEKVRKFSQAGFVYFGTHFKFRIEEKGQQF